MIEHLVTQFNMTSVDDDGLSDRCRLASMIEEEVMRLYNMDAPSDALLERRLKQEKELSKWEVLLKFTNGTRGRLLDCGFGSGRDILIARKYGFDAYGCEKCEKYYSDFIATYPEMIKNVKCCDMKDLLFENEFFDVVRHNASFIHMPIIAHGLTAHKVLEETYRVLKRSGIVYIYTKAGDGFQAQDTGEGFGFRPFQFYTVDSMSSILEDCGFEVKYCDVLHKQRNIMGIDNIEKVVKIDWIEAIAAKI